MVGSFKSVALAGAIMVAATPAFAQNFDPFGIGAALGTTVTPPPSVDLDPLHIFTPAPPPPAPTTVSVRRHHYYHHRPGHYARKRAYRYGF